MKTRTSLLIQSFLPFHYTMFEINKKSHLNFCAKIVITCTYLFDTKNIKLRYAHFFIPNSYMLDEGELVCKHNHNNQLYLEVL